MVRTEVPHRLLARNCPCQFVICQIPKRVELLDNPDHDDAGEHLLLNMILSWTTGVVRIPLYTCMYLQLVGGLCGKWMQPPAFISERSLPGPPRLARLTSHCPPPTSLSPCVVQPLLANAAFSPVP